MAERDRFPTLLPLSQVHACRPESVPVASHVRAPIFLGRSLEGLLPAILETVPTPILVVDSQQRLVLVNGAVREFFGVEESSLLGYSATRYLSRDKLEEAFETLHRTDRAHSYRDVINLMGVEREVEIDVDLLDTDRGQFLCLHLRDRTDDDRERAEWASTSSEVPSSRLDRAHHWEALGQLTGSLAHDFNNLLAVILGSLDSAIVRMQRGLNPAPDLERAMFATERSIDATAEVLHYTRQTARVLSLLPPTETVLDFRGLLERAVGNEVELTLTTEATPPIRVEPAQFEAALLNLVINARDAVGEGGVVHVGLSSRMVEGDESDRVGLVPQQYVVLRVVDNGVGMTPEVQSRVFEPFFTTKPDGLGTGLGLSTIHSLMRRLGGAVRLNSELGSGTSVELYFPAVPPE